MSTIWLDSALDDLERLGRYIEERDTGNAQVVLARIFTTVRTLDQFARRGRIGRLRVPNRTWVQGLLTGVS